MIPFSVMALGVIYVPQLKNVHLHLLVLSWIPDLNI